MAEGGGLLNGNPPLGHPRFPVYILRSLLLHTSIELASVGSRRTVLVRVRDNLGDSAVVAIRRLPLSICASAARVSTRVTLRVEGIP